VICNKLIAAGVFLENITICASVVQEIPVFPFKDPGGSLLCLQ